MIKAFQLLYKGRKSMESLQTEDEIRNIIKLELLDEFTHPRARQSVEKKYAIALERIKNSELSIDKQNKIIAVYQDEYTKLST